MEVKVSNCNNIDNGVISILPNALNIKYAINGTGKSTISKAIVSSILDREKGSRELEKLKPFKYFDTKDGIPQVTGIDQLSSVRVFDEEYANKYVFLPDELLQGSFDIFIRGEEYDRGMAEINELTRSIQEMFGENTEIDELITDFSQLSSSFGQPVKKGIHGSSNIVKAFKDGNKIHNVPDEVKEYGEYIKSENNIKWIKWIIDGRVYLDLSDNCPYCVSNITKKKDKIAKVSDLYDPRTIEYLNRIVLVFNKLNKYFSAETKQLVEQFIQSPSGYTDDQVRYLLEIKDQIDSLNKKFQDAKQLGFKSLKNVDKVIEQLRNQKIEITYYSHLKSEATNEKASIVNSAIDQILKTAGVLQGKINLQKEHVQKVIKENKDEINGFLTNAGYRYEVDIIEDEKKQYSIKLLHRDYIKSSIDNVRQRLSFGERNAFAIILFMYDALKSKPDLIVLDDPISSFDKHKKYAIVDMLFRKDRSLRGKTILMLTHDIEPIVDMVYHHRDRFAVTSAAFLENDHGVLTEKSITKQDISTFLKICEKNAKHGKNDLTKLVYIRRKLEILDDKDAAYNLISNLLHRREIPVVTTDKNRRMTTDEIEDGCNRIRAEGVNLDYPTMYSLIINDQKLLEWYQQTNSNYEKLHIFRVFSESKDYEAGSLVINKFINEAFHIENEYIYQLNPCEYQLVPQYVIDECNKILAASLDKPKATIQ